MKDKFSSVAPIYVFSLIIGIFGAAQILNAGSMADNVPDFLPAPKLFTYLTGTALVLAAIAFIIDRYAKLAGYLLCILLLLIVFTVDLPGVVSAETVEAKSIFTTNALKDGALAMAAFIIGNLSKH